MFETDEEPAVLGHTISEADRDDVIRLIEASSSKNVPLRDLPTFFGQGHEDADDFLLKLECCSVTYGWSDVEYLIYISLTMGKNVLSCFDANKTVQAFWEMKNKLSETFGRSQVDYDLLGEGGKMAIKGTSIYLPCLALR